MGPGREARVLRCGVEGGGMGEPPVGLWGIGAKGVCLLLLCGLGWISCLITFLGSTNTGASGVG